MDFPTSFLVNSSIIVVGKMSVIPRKRLELGIVGNLQTVAVNKLVSIEGRVEDVYTRFPIGIHILLYHASLILYMIFNSNSISCMIRS